MISSIISNLLEGWTNGRKLEEVWTSGYKIWPSEQIDFDGMILNITTPSNDFKLNLFDYVGGSDVDNAVINWGDGSDSIKIDPSTESLSHTYSISGDYQLKISGRIKWKGKHSSDVRSSLSKSLISIELPTRNSPMVDLGQYAFDEFDVLIAIPGGLFDKCVGVTNFTGCFEGCKSLQSIPENLFSSCTEATNFDYCFNRCSSLQSIPEKLFNHNATRFMSCFSACTSLQSIPDGLFDECVKATSFSECFNSCKSLQSIPEGLFDNNTLVGTFSYCFDGCESLQSIPENLFDNNTLVTGFGYCFSGCKSLQSIPEGLFDNNTLVTTFSNCFAYCSSLQSIPEGLFDKCTKVTNFSYCFRSCTSVTSNLPTLWISHPNATHTQCFNYCDKAPNYPEAYAAGWATSPAVSLMINTLQDNQSIDLSSYIKPTGDSTNIDIEWGDNSEQESTSIHNIQHTYANKGEYAVEIYGDIEWVEPKARTMQSGWSITLSKY